MKTIIFQSEMNDNPPIDLGVRGDEIFANEYIDSLGYNTWVYFKDIPNGIKTNVIDTLICGIEGKKVIFDELDERFFITRESNHLGLSLCLKKEHKIA